MKTLHSIALMGVLVSALWMTGCVVHDGHHHARYHHTRYQHVHSAHCGHYYSGGNWHYMHRHVHGPSCGHMLNGGIWVTVR